MTSTAGLLSEIERLRARLKDVDGQLDDARRSMRVMREKLARVETVAAALRNHPPEDMMGVTMLIGGLSDVLSDAPTDDAKPDSG